MDEVYYSIHEYLNNHHEFISELWVKDNKVTHLRIGSGAVPYPAVLVINSNLVLIFLEIYYHYHELKPSSCDIVLDLGDPEFFATLTRIIDNLHRAQGANRHYKKQLLEQRWKPTVQ